MRVTKTFRLILVILLAFWAEFGSSAITRTHKYKMKLPEVCKAGKVYNITKIQDLWDNIDDLECIYRVGEEPTSILVGPMVGVCFTVGNSYAANPVAKAIWTGKYTMNVTCGEKKKVHLGWNGVFGDIAFPYAMFIGKLNDVGNMHPVWKDNRSTIVLDYSRPMSHYCPNYYEMLNSDNEQMKFKRSADYQMIAPFIFVIDGMRPVGRQKDGGLIYLGQTYVRDGYRSDVLTYPVAFFAVISYDKNVEKHIKYGHTLTPLKEDVHYYLYNSLDFVNAILPVDNFFTEPFTGVTQFIYQFVTGFRNAINFSIKYIAGITGEERQIMKRDMEEIMVKYRAFMKEEEAHMNSTAKKSLLLSHDELIHSHYNEL